MKVTVSSQDLYFIHNYRNYDMFTNILLKYQQKTLTIEDILKFNIEFNVRSNWKRSLEMLAVLLGNYDFFIYVSYLSIEKYKSPSDSVTAVSLSIEMGNLCFLKFLSNHEQHLDANEHQVHQITIQFCHKLDNY